ncbi:acyltransferase [Bergeyella zoohelcum]|uniref:Maltose/galactoside acetyltransferase domain-containing protein n=1 Tax=Bergeyella zoohelcum ATCC 43767 TaxID=883096 RepID=K1LCS2_9FLAO|nr:acyltransferase [Bergeyella zoohelcum]EKB54420.1 hypothetical protein HMPREF9699_01963 [Bergeyella zoohelcum ATCC 43767]SUV49962.1 Galactoside O-acetyltransferase [Bergeyella zoohelcum]
MNLVYRIIIKVHSLWALLYHKAYVKICKSRGLKLGKNVILIGTPDFGSEPYLIEIGDKTKITDGCRFINHDGAMYVIRNMETYADARNFGRIKIGKNCFIGNGCTFLPGSKMGDNCILGAGSILNSTMPDNTVYAGIPAKFICTIEEYGNKALKNNTLYPRKLEQNRADLDRYISENLPYKYKSLKK